MTRRTDFPTTYLGLSAAVLSRLLSTSLLCSLLFVALSGSAYAQNQNCFVTSVNFGDVMVGDSAQRTTTGVAGVLTQWTVQSVTLSGPNAGDFAITSDLCTGITLTP
jgi:hypothetical protein